MGRDRPSILSLAVWVLWPVVALGTVLLITVNWRGWSLTAAVSLNAAILLGMLVTNSVLVLKLRRLGLIRNVFVLLACWLCALLAQLAGIFVVANLIFIALYEPPGSAAWVPALGIPYGAETQPRLPYV